jgi:hypothetical protein
VEHSSGNRRAQYEPMGFLAFLLLPHFQTSFFFFRRNICLSITITPCSCLLLFLVGLFLCAQSRLCKPNTQTCPSVSPNQLLTTLRQNSPSHENRNFSTLYYRLGKELYRYPRWWQAQEKYTTLIIYSFHLVIVKLKNLGLLEEKTKYTSFIEKICLAVFENYISQKLFKNSISDAARSYFTWTI